MRIVRVGLVILLALPAAAGAQPVTAAEAIATQRRQLEAVTGGAARARDCDPAAEPGEIVVCGRDDGERHRLPLPVEPMPGERRRLLGEAPTGTEAMAADRCFRMCQTGAMIDVFGLVRGPARVAGRILDPDDD